MYTIYALYNRLIDRIYVGQTRDLVNRLEMHRSKTLKGYTARGGGKWELVYSETVSSRGEALKREKQLKSYQGRKFIRNNIPR